MQITIDTKSTQEWQATIGKALGCLEHLLDDMHEAERRGLLS